MFYTNPSACPPGHACDGQQFFISFVRLIRMNSLCPSSRCDCRRYVRSSQILVRLLVYKPTRVFYLVAGQRAARAAPADRRARIVAQLHAVVQLKLIARHVAAVGGKHRGEARVVQQPRVWVGGVCREAQVKTAARACIIKRFVSLVIKDKWLTTDLRKAKGGGGARGGQRRGLKIK